MNIIQLENKEYFQIHQEICDWFRNKQLSPNSDLTYYLSFNQFPKEMKEINLLEYSIDNISKFEKEKPKTIVQKWADVKAMREEMVKNSKL